jgi:predicted permease
MDSLRQDLRQAGRALRARPGFTAVAVVTLALGVGANTAIFSVVNALLIRPLPVEDVDRLVFGMALREGFDPFGTSLLEYALYRDQAPSLASSGLGAPRLFNLVGQGDPEHVRGAAVMASYLATLGVRPSLGRIFTAEEDEPGGPPVALVGHGLWQRRFGGDPGILGTWLELEGRSHSIVGVMPPGFDLPYSAEVWVPMQVDVAALPFDQRAATAHEFVGRLRPGASLAQAERELKALARRLESEHPQVRRGWSFGIVALRQQLMADLEGRTRRSLIALVVAVGFLLLICCANVASLLLARGVAREGELAIRAALGAGRGRILRQLLTEASLLAGLGGAAGVLLAVWSQPVLRALDPLQATGLGSYLTGFRVDARVLAFSLAVTWLTSVLCGLIPALRASRAAGPAHTLRRREQRAGASAAQRGLQALAAAEMAVATALLVGGALVAQSFWRLQKLDLGFRPSGLSMLELPLSPAKYESLPARIQLTERVLERVRALPGVLAAGITTNVPLQRGVILDSVYEAEGRPNLDPSEVPITSHRLVSHGYMETLGLRLVRGRMLDERDAPSDAAAVVVVSEALARQAWPGQDAVGRRVRRIRASGPGPWMSVVGVVGDVKEDRFGFRIDRPVWYVPFAQHASALPVSLPLNLVVRASADAASLRESVRSAVRAVDPDQPIANATSMEQHLAGVLISERFGALLMGTLAGVGLLVAALGLYGVMSYGVSQRTSEIGLRVALGASPRAVLGLVLGNGLALVAAGLLGGLAAAAILARLLANMLFGVSANDPGTFTLVALVLTASALAACWLPARRAARLDPLVALRRE